MCGDKCTKINDLCRDVSNALSCSDQFHLNCKQTQDQNQVSHYSIIIISIMLLLKLI